MVRERARNGIPGLPMAAVILAVIAAAAWTFIRFVRAAQVDAENPWVMVLVVLLGVLAIFLIRGFFLISPNEAQVLQLFGDYAGTAKVPGLRWANPFFTRKKLSLRVR